MKPDPTPPRLHGAGPPTPRLRGAGPPTPEGLQAASHQPTAEAGKPASEPQRSTFLPLLLSVVAAFAVIVGVLLVLFPRPSPLTTAQERLARIESVRILRRLDLLKSEVIGLVRKQSALRLFGALSVRAEQRERVSLLQELLEATRPAAYN